MNFNKDKTIKIKKEFSLSHNYFFERNGGNGHSSDLKSEKPAKDELAEKIRSKIISFPANLGNFYLVSAEIKFSDVTLPSKANFAAPQMYIFDGMSVLTTFKGETRTRPAIVLEAKGRFYFETIIETAHPVNDNDFVEKAAFVKDGYYSLVLKNLDVNNHRVHCGIVLMKPITEKSKGDGSLCERSIIPKIEDFIL